MVFCNFSKQNLSEIKKQPNDLEYFYVTSYKFTMPF